MRLAIFGGTFDPIHHAHLAVAAAAADRFELDRVLLIPAANPPHKPGAHAPYEHRLAMVRLAAVADPRFEASDLEARTGQSFSILTIGEIGKQLTDSDRLFFIIGADAFAEIGTWYRHQDVIRSVEFIVVTRPGHRYAIPEGARVHELGGLSLPVSSSVIRAELASGARPEPLPDAVYAYIREHGLYRQSAGAGVLR